VTLALTGYKTFARVVRRRAMPVFDCDRKSGTYVDPVSVYFRGGYGKVL
jgi:hypothetical protein